MIMIIRSYRTRVYSNGLIFLFWLVLLSLTSALRVPCLSYAKYRLILTLGSHLILSSHAHLPYTNKANILGPYPTPKVPPIIPATAEGREKIGRRENKTKKLRHRMTWWFTSDLQVSSGNIRFGRIPSFPPLVALLLSPISLEKVVGGGYPENVSFCEMNYRLGTIKAKCSNPLWKIKCFW